MRERVLRIIDRYTRICVKPRFGRAAFAFSEAAVAHRHKAESGIDKHFERRRTLTQMKRIAVKIEEGRVAGACRVHPGLQSHFVGRLKKNVFHPAKTKCGRRRGHFHRKIHQVSLEGE